MYERLKRLYQEGRASEAMLKNAVKRGWITVAADTETWIQNAKEAEASGEQPSELEILTKTVTKQQAQIESINQSVDDITLAILGGE